MDEITIIGRVWGGGDAIRKFSGKYILIAVSRSFASDAAWDAEMD